jgi:phosphatidylserine/phosphatidylglycerophosphate/cardiolipin synthase-like enzyme
MAVPDFDQVLRATLVDRRLSGGERDALRAVLAEMHADDNRRAALRHRVFELARAELITDDAAKVVGWVEDVLKALTAADVRPATTHSEACFSPGDDCVARITRLFTEARSSADVCVFTITDDRLADALLAAHRRGLVIRLITDNDKAHDLGSDIGRIEAAGVPVRIDRTPFHMHHKFALFDGRRLLNGSYNWTRGAARDNQENLVITDDPTLVARFAAAFAALWAELE